MVRCWFVERSIDDGRMVTVVYATPDGQQRLERQTATGRLARDGFTAAVDVDPDDLEDVADPETAERYAAEASRTAERYDPEDTV